MEIDGFNPRSRAGNPYKAVWSSVLLDAIKCTKPHPVKSNRRPNGERDMTRASTVNWFASKSIAPGSFIWVCNALDRDPERVLAGIQNNTGLRV